MEPTLAAQPVRSCPCPPGPRLHCLLHPDSPHDCHHIDVLLALDVSYGALLARVPAARLEDVYPRYRACWPDGGAAIPQTFAQADGGRTGGWLVGVTVSYGGRVLGGHITGSAN